MEELTKEQEELMLDAKYERDREAQDRAEEVEKLSEEQE
jgi:hypothetical protein